MPELPEVETVRRGLIPALEGQTIVRVEQRRPNLRVPFPLKFVERLTGRTVTQVSRRAKYILVHFDNDEVLVVHLGMSGRFKIDGLPLRTAAKYVFAAPAELGPHDHVVIETNGGSRIVFTDHRRFGLMTLIHKREISTHKLLAGLGPEPLTGRFSASVLLAAFDGKRTPVKSALLDQHLVSGLGNIYVCEALFGAGISPLRPANSITNAEGSALVLEVKRVLRAAIRAGGSTLRDYQKTSGELGYFQHRFCVYGREDEECVRRLCRGRVGRITQAGRSTFYCATCQR